MKRIGLISVFAVVILVMSLAIANAAQYGATYTPKNTPSCMEKDKTVTVNIDVKNTGTKTWVPGAFTLSYHWYQGATQVVWDGLRTPLPSNVLPNATVSLNAQVKAPANNGTYTLKWDMAHEGVVWFSNAVPPVPTANQTVQVKDSCQIVQIDPNKYKLLNRCFLKVGCPNCPPDVLSKFKLSSNPPDSFRIATRKVTPQSKRLLFLQNQVGQLGQRAKLATSLAEINKIEQEAGVILAELEGMAM